MFRALNILLHLLLSASVFGQLIEQEVRYDLARITIDDGLPQGMVQDILQDRQGYLWFTTKDGLARSDGYAFTIFQHDPEDPASIAGNHSDLLFEDRNGGLWIAVFGEGLDRYDPRTGRFDHVHFPVGTPREAFLDVDRIREGPQGGIWFTSVGEYLYVVDPKDPELLARPARTIHPKSHIPTRVSYFEFDATGALWVMNGDSVVCDPSLRGSDTTAATVWPIPTPLPPRNGTLEKHPMVHWRQGHKVVVSVPSMLLLFDTHTHAVDTLRVPAGQHVWFTQLVDDAGRLWYRTDDNRIWRVDLHTGRFEPLHFTADGKDVYEEFQTVLFRCQDRSGNLWGGSKGYGVFKLGRTSTRFQRRASIKMDGYYVDAYTILGHRQYAMTRHALREDPAPAPPGWLRYTIGTTVNGRNWIGAVDDTKGRTWGVLADGDRSPAVLGYLDPAGAFHTVDLLEDAPSRVFHGRGSQIWVVTSGGRETWNLPVDLACIDTDAMRVIGRHSFPVEFLLSKYWPISQWSVAPDGTIWMATMEGLLALDPAKNAWHSFQHDPADPSSLPTNLLFSLCPDPDEPDHFIWVGTESAGMARLDKRTGSCKRVSTADGLPNNVIYSILPDAAGQLWIGTNTGLCRYDPRTGAARTFTKDDGIAGNEFNRYGSLVLPDGSMFFDGMDGGTSFHPADLTEGKDPSPTLLTGIRLATRSIAMHELLDTAGTLLSLTLPHNEPLVTFQFALMDHTAPKRNTFRYRLVGYTDEWIDGSTRNEATFTNLDPGDYTFEVQGTDHEGMVDPHLASIHLSILPPWWRTWWFRAALALLIMGSVYALYRIRLEQQLREIRLREHIARDLHDEIGSTLSSVALYGAVARKKLANIGPEGGRLLERISEGTTSAMESINDIVWTVNASKDSLADLAERMRSHATPLCEARGVTLDLQVDEALLQDRLNMGQRKNLYLIFKEAVNNAIKYAACSRITIRLSGSGERLTMTIADDGRGFDPEVNSGPGPGGNGLGNMRERGAEAGGVCTISSEIGRGTTVTFRTRAGT
ncbi:MAG: two-component regulator propeller domain-containing protein [Flavobacteriales bacterium]